MLNREFYYSWETALQSAPEEYWPLIADTNRFNQDTGLPTLTQLNEGDLKNAHRELRIFRLGIPVTWVEEPFEWVRPKRFGGMRRYSTGPVAEMRVLANLEETKTGGTRLTYEVWAKPRNLLGLIAIPIQIGVISARDFKNAFHKYDQIALGEISPIPLKRISQLAPGASRRMQEAVNRLVSSGIDVKVLQALVELVTYSDNLTVAQIRPYVFADLWGFERKEVLNACLFATREGLLDFRWQLLCPSCRVSKDIKTSLKDLPGEVHCETCRVDFAVNLEQAVELTFKPNNAIREVPDRVEFCVAGPQVTPHVISQQLILPGNRQEISPGLDFYRYRIRSLAYEGATYLMVDKNGRSEITLVQEKNNWVEQPEAAVAPDATITLVNNSDEERLFILEHVHWSDDALTAAEVIATQNFRDLFASEALKPGEQFSVGEITIAFTDLRASTQMYQDIGDAVAFGYVLNHFEILQNAIVAENGAVVKTIGDAIMAVFKRPIEALRAMRTAQSEISKMEGQPPRLHLKVGIHQGPGITVTLNERLDYFGSTINLASRLVEFSNGTNIVVSSKIIADTEVRTYLEANRCSVTTILRNVKGFDTASLQIKQIDFL